MKKALITGITGQDGSYLAEFLLEKGYEVHGIKRRSSSFNTQRIDHIYQDPNIDNRQLILHYGDLTDSSNIIRIIRTISPDEIYNLAAQSHVAVSFDSPEYTADVGALGTLRILEAIRFLGLENKTKFYQASTSELYGLVQESPQNEDTPFYPRSPYAVSKLFSYWTVVNYETRNFACNILFMNHQGGGPSLWKITMAQLYRQGLQDCLYLGNLGAKRDWGHARDYVRMQWMMLQQESPEDFVIASGEQFSVRDFITMAARKIGIEIEFSGNGLNEVGVVKSVASDFSDFIEIGETIVRVNPRYFRPTEVEELLGDASKAKNKLGWKPEISLEELCEEMVKSDLDEARRRRLLMSHGHEVDIPRGD